MFIRSVFRFLIAALSVAAIAMMIFLPIMTSTTDLNTILIGDNLSLMNLFVSLKGEFSNSPQTFLRTVFDYSLVIVYMLFLVIILFAILVDALKGMRKKKKKAKIIGKSFFLIYWIAIIFIVRMLINPATFNVNLGPFTNVLNSFMVIFLRSVPETTVMLMLAGAAGFFVFFELFARALNARIAYSSSLKSVERKKANKDVNLTPNNELLFSGVNNATLNPSFNQPNMENIVNPTNTIIYNSEIPKDNSQVVEEPLAKQNNVPLQNRVIYQQEAPKWSGLPSYENQKANTPKASPYENEDVNNVNSGYYQGTKETIQPGVKSGFEQGNQAYGYKEPYARQNPNVEGPTPGVYSQPKDPYGNQGPYNAPNPNYNQGYNRPPNQPYYGQNNQPNNPYYNQNRDSFNKPAQPYYGQNAQPNNPYYNQARDPYSKPNQGYGGQRNDFPNQNPYQPNTPVYDRNAFEQVNPAYQNVPPQAPVNDVKPDPIVQTNTVNCSDCGTIVIKGQKFCSNCGKQMKQNCPQCSTEVSSNSKFCSSCGFKIN